MFRYGIIVSVGAVVQLQQGGSMNVLQALNIAGSHGGELTAVVQQAGNALWWVLKYPAQAPSQSFESNPQQ
jgi:hypothetical protein